MEFTSVLIISLITGLAYLHRRFCGDCQLERPIVLGPVVGLILGDFSTGLFVGGSLELVFMGAQAIGGSVPSNVAIASALGTAGAIVSGTGLDGAMVIAIPVAVVASTFETFAKAASAVFVLCGCMVGGTGTGNNAGNILGSILGAATNANTIGIEVVSAGKVFTAAQQAALNELVTWLMDQHDVKAANVVRHYDASRKLCPAPYCGNATKNDRWAKLRQTITGKVAEAKPVASKVSAKTANAATNYTKSLAGTYRCTDDLNLRVGAGVRQKIKVEMPYNTKVQCYGYWTPSGTTKWLLVTVKIDGVEYVGYCSKNFLKKVV